MLTDAAARSLRDPDQYGADTVTTMQALCAAGWSRSAIRAQLRAHRWQTIGGAIVRHNGEPDVRELRDVALAVQGPRALLTSFTALSESGLTGWERQEVHVLLPRAARAVRPPGLDLRVHYTSRWPAEPHARRLHAVADSAVLAAAEFAEPRHGCGLLAAVVQQRLTSAQSLLSALEAAPRTRHRHLLLAAVRDIAGGAEALSEIDFARLRRRARLPEPTRQAVRTDRYGRRRYLDAEWRLPDGRRVVVEVDGAVHLNWRVRAGDDLRQNELVIGGDLVLRYPSVTVRCQPAILIDQLRRVLGC